MFVEPLSARLLPFSVASSPATACISRAEWVPFRFQPRSDLSTGLGCFKASTQATSRWLALAREVAIVRNVVSEPSLNLRDLMGLAPVTASRATGRLRAQPDGVGVNVLLGGDRVALRCCWPLPHSVLNATLLQSLAPAAPSRGTARCPRGSLPSDLLPTAFARTAVLRAAPDGYRGRSRRVCRQSLQAVVAPASSTACAARSRTYSRWSHPLIPVR